MTPCDVAKWCPDGGAKHTKGQSVWQSLIGKGNMKRTTCMGSMLMLGCIHWLIKILLSEKEGFKNTFQRRFFSQRGFFKINFWMYVCTIWSDSTKRIKIAEAYLSKQIFTKKNDFTHHNNLQEWLLSWSRPVGYCHILKTFVNNFYWPHSR